MSDAEIDAVIDADDTRRGRLFVVTGPHAPERTGVATALARRSARAIAIECSSFDTMLVSGRQDYDDPPTVEQIRQRFLRWSAGIATAETYLLEGFDAVISDAILGSFLDDFLDLVTPEPVHLVVLGDTMDPALASTPRYGLWLDTGVRSPDEAAHEVLGSLEESLVVTDEG
ncbi:MAG TPA: hypothetical protein VFT81_00610 [Dermatophilaceae bacterium]|nr:hypothetical protein [Dermatophilaceae bacterium]